MSTVVEITDAITDRIGLMQIQIASPEAARSVRVAPDAPAAPTTPTLSGALKGGPAASTSGAAV